MSTAATMTPTTNYRGSQEFIDAMVMFEKVLKKGRTRAQANPGNRAKRKPDGTWPWYFYEDGLASDLFEMFLQGLSYGKCLMRD